MKTLSKMNFVVWWYETNDFDGKTRRVYRDFETIRGARAFKRTKEGSELDTIESQKWHHRHATVSLANAGAYL